MHTDLSGERTFLALGRNLLARTALVENNPDEAAAHSAQAVSLLLDSDTPLAEWRVCETAAQLALLRGRAAEADSWLTRSSSTLAHIVSFIDTAEPLRAALLALRDRRNPK
jgi:hypothetical protein